jgi:hypothetical protein
VNATPGVIERLPAGALYPVGHDGGLARDRQYRFEHQDVRVLLWSDNGQCDWLISAATEVSLRKFTAGLAGLPSLRTARWADEA